MIRLHEEALQDFIGIWRLACAEELGLPQTRNPDYASLEKLLRHVLSWARDYMVWTCEQLELPDPQIRLAPAAGKLAAELDDYLGHLFERWRLPLRDVAPARFRESYASRWGVSYCIDGMLEHAVMHPIRHGFQLKELMGDAR